MLLTMRVLTGERMSYTFPFQCTCAVLSKICLLRKPHMSKHINHSVLYHMHVQFTCAIAWKLFHELYGISVQVKNGKKCATSEFLEWVDLQKSKDGAQCFGA